MKPGELERNLSRLVTLAIRARERLDSIETQVSDLRAELEASASSAHAEPTKQPSDEQAIEGANPTRASAVAQAEVLFK